MSFQTFALKECGYVEQQFYTLQRLGMVLEGHKTVTGYVPKVQEILRKPLSWINTDII